MKFPKTPDEVVIEILTSSDKANTRKVLSMLFFVSAIAIVACTTQGPNELLIGNWKMVVDTVHQDSLPGMAGMPQRGVYYEFINDSLVDTKRRYFKITYSATGVRKYKFLGTRTKYKFEGDSLKFFNLTDSVWEGMHLKALTKDRMVLVDASGKKLTFLRRTYKDENPEDINSIALSSSGCYGVCPAMNIIINSNGGVVFYGERFVDKIGFYEGQIPKEMFDRIRAEFKKSAIKKLAQDYSALGTDSETISTTFVSDGKIVNSIRDYGQAGPDELVWGYLSLRYLFQDLHLTRLDTAKLPFYIDLHFLQFEANRETGNLTQSESFLLWNYLRNGTIVQQKANNKFSLVFDRNHTPWIRSDSMWNSYTIKTEQRVKRITTDGQLYNLEMDGGRIMTVDIGFNFFELNEKFLSFEQQEVPWEVPRQ